jgi:magnesium transporter
MNFDPHTPGNMPELDFPYAYWICLGVMLAIALSLVYYFKRRGWFDNFSNAKD